ncbi:MAG TPA: GntR family transcriptional regulator [Devosiaceae bacterium]|jgi:DNA-binding GntR family transcriptional regulator
MAEKLDKATTATVVSDQLRQDILRGTLEPGQKLAIDAIAQRYGVGTNPVREALNRLSSERLVDRHDQRGFFVPSIDLEGWRELVKTRCWLETKALEESIRNRTTAWEEQIVLTLHRMSRSPWTERDTDMSKRALHEGHHRDFHMALIANCGSSWMLQFCEVLMDHAQRYIFVAAGTGYSRQHATEEHKEIADAALDGRIEMACALLVAHYTRTLGIIEQIIRA